MKKIVELDAVSFAYNTESILEDVHLSVLEGEFASIVGPNGGGKTTLVRLILGLLHPQTGTIRLFGGSPKKNRLRVGYTPQHQIVDYRFPITALDVVLTGRINAGSSKGLWESLLPFRFSALDREEALAALDLMGIADKKDLSFGSLSGGERQRVLLARALCSRPELLILDEPTNNIDPTGIEILYELLSKLNEKIAILLVSHDLGVVSQFVQSVICVNRKVVVHPTSAFNGTMIREIYGADIRLVRHDHRCSEHG
ncbi:MAG: metal ABC transporter ATP-binding protein, partial [Planctomycetia bacterium]|nr:metal ABC transporter ATP-binding protein [Planctomycetia bacterium]